MIISEGLLVYLTEEEVTALGHDLAAPAAFQHWVIDLVSPALLRMLAKKMGAPLDQAGIPLKFAPQEGPDFFARAGWASEEVHSVMHTAARLNRLSFFLRLLPEFPRLISKPNVPALLYVCSRKRIRSEDECSFVSEALHRCKRLHCKL